MRTILAASLAGAALVLVSAAQSGNEVLRPSDSLERPFAAGGRIRLDLSAGDYRVSGGPEPRIRVEWTVRDADQLSKVRIGADVQGSHATLTTSGPQNGFRVVIRVPARSDLHVRLTAGDLTVEGIEGNKDVESRAGDVRIDVGRADDYSRVDASVWAGDLDARPYHVSKGGLFRSFDWRGSGPYRLHAHLLAGDLRLYSQPVPAR
jgi:hypothetical protein